MTETKLLAKIFRRMLIALNVTEDQFKKKMVEHVEQEKHPIAMHKAAKCAQFTKALRNDSMGIKTFLAAAKVLKISNIHISVSLMDESGKSIKTSAIQLNTKE